MFGYFVRRVDKRFQLERSLGLLPQNQEEAVARLERLFSQVSTSFLHHAAHPSTQMLSCTERTQVRPASLLTTWHVCSRRQRPWMEQTTLTHLPRAHQPPRMHHQRATPPASQQRASHQRAPASRRPRPQAISRPWGRSRPRARRSAYPCESAPHRQPLCLHLARSSTYTLHRGV